MPTGKITRGPNCGNYGAPGLANTLLSRMVNAGLPNGRLDMPKMRPRYDLRGFRRHSMELPGTEIERLWKQSFTT
jgi:hypothetical protein